MTTNQPGSRLSEASGLSDATVRHLQQIAGWPDLTETRYEAIETIGQGGMGVVFRARDRGLERDVAVKVLALDSRADETRLRQEARILASLEHPGIVPIYDVGRVRDGRLFYVMMLVRGARLDEFARGPASLADRLRVFDRICEPVAYAHAHGVIHRDLKPANVMIGRFGEVLVLDWGIARVRAEAAPVETEAAIVGTEGYMAPEQAHGNGAAAGPASDVFSLGAILRELVGNAPEPPRGRRQRALAAIITKAMAEAPHERYAGALELAADVRHFLDGEPVTAYPESLTERFGRLLWTYRVPFALVASYLLMRVALIVWGRR